jgi:hypothetical protein
MRTLGIVVDPGGGNPKIFGVVVSGSVDEPVLEEEFELNTSSSESSEQVAELALRLQGKLSGTEFDEAGVRVAGASPVASRRKAKFSRAHAEGAAIFVVREHIQRPIIIGDPKSFATKTGLTQAALVARAQQLSNAKADAVIAAIAAFTL